MSTARLLHLERPAIGPRGRPVKITATVSEGGNGPEVRLQLKGPPREPYLVLSASEAEAAHALLGAALRVLPKVRG